MKRQITVGFDKPKASSTPPDPNATPVATFERVISIIKDNAREAAVGFVAVYAAVKTVDAVCEIAVNASPKRH